MKLPDQCYGNPELPALLMLHGFMGAASDWEAIAAVLSERFYCIAIDLPGHGLSAEEPESLPWSMENTARWVIDVLDQRGLPQANLLGYSMGGRLALFLALAYPQRWKRLILESASPGLAQAKERRERRSQDEHLAQRILSADWPHPLLEQWYQNPIFGDISRHPHFSRLLQQRAQNNPKALARSLREMGTGQQPSLWPRLTEIKLPLLLVIGEKDVKFEAISTRMAAANPAFRKKIVPGCGHNCHFERPGEFAGIVSDFCREN